MQFFADIIDQLDLALDQIAMNDRNFDRFSLMLIDNAIELTLHRYSKDKANENRFWEKLQKPKYDPQDIQNGLSQNFDQKAKFAAKYGLFDKSVCDSILNLHSLRNTTFHQGQRHERILHSAASFYFAISCTLLKNYKPGCWCSSSNDKYSHRAIKYLGNPTHCDTEKTIANAFNRLEEVVNSMVTVR